jgi:hypothetical protein
VKPTQQLVCLRGQNRAAFDRLTVVAVPAGPDAGER